VVAQENLRFLEGLQAEVGAAAEKAHGLRHHPSEEEAEAVAQTIISFRDLLERYSGWIRRTGTPATTMVSPSRTRACPATVLPALDVSDDDPLMATTRSKLRATGRQLGRPPNPSMPTARIARSGRGMGDRLRRVYDRQ
jgi:hypothetical protein